MRDNYSTSLSAADPLTSLYPYFNLRTPCAKQLEAMKYKICYEKCRACVIFYTWYVLAPSVNSEYSFLHHLLCALYMYLSFPIILCPRTNPKKSSSFLHCSPGKHRPAAFVFSRAKSKYSSVVRNAELCSLLSTLERACIHIPACSLGAPDDNCVLSSVYCELCSMKMAENFSRK